MHFDSDPTTLMITVAGSHAYGMGTATSDLDLRGVCVTPRAIRNSFHRSFEQWQSAKQVGPWGARSVKALEELRSRGGTAHASYVRDNRTADVTVFSLTKFMKLASAANPNVLELLFVDDRSLLYSDPHWDHLRDERQLFLSRKCRHTYSGYAHSQMRRIRTHREWLLHPPTAEPTRREFGLPESSTLSADDRNRIDETVGKVIRQWGVEEGLEDVLTGATLDVLRERMLDFQQAALGVDRERLDDALYQAAAQSLGLSGAMLDVLKAERAYRGARKHWQQYQNWKALRNPARAELEARHGHDTKHAAHLVRLMRTGTEVLRDGVLRVMRPDAEELLAIRRGAWTFEQLEEEADREEWRMRDAVDQSPLPRTADLAALDALHSEILEATT